MERRGNLLLSIENENKKGEGKMKKALLSFTLAAAMIAGTIAVNPVAKTTTAEAATTTQVVNYALGKDVIASSTENADYVAQNAVDGNMSTRWSSAFNDGEWFVVDLGQIRTVGSVRMYWEAAYAAEYTISWSQDNVTWYDAASRICDYYSSETSEMFYNRPVRYIKITMDRRGTVYGSSLYEFEVLGLEEVEETTTEAPTTEVPTTSQPTVTNIALNKPATASSIEGVEYDASKAFDGDMNTRWSSQFSDDQWLTVSLGKICHIEYVEFQWEAAYAAFSEVQVSFDGENWTSYRLTKSHGISDRLYVFTAGRYVRFKGVRRATPYGYSIYEMRVGGWELY